MVISRFSTVYASTAFAVRGNRHRSSASRQAIIHPFFFISSSFLSCSLCSVYHLSLCQTTVNTGPAAAFDRSAKRLAETAVFHDERLFFIADACYTKLWRAKHEID